MITMLRYIGLRVSAKTPLETMVVVGRIGMMELFAFQIACAPERARANPAITRTAPAAMAKVRGNDVNGYFRSNNQPASSPARESSGGGKRTPELSGSATKPSRTFLLPALDPRSIAATRSR